MYEHTTYMNMETQSHETMDKLQAAGSGDLPTTQQGTTTFEDDQKTVTVAFNNNKHNTSTLTGPPSISYFLQKPVLVSNFAYATTSTSNAVLASGQIGSNLTSSAIWANKLSGYNQIKGKAVIRLIINANPFQAGKLLLLYFPAINSVSTSGTSVMYNRHVVNLAATRQLPCVELNIRDSTAILEIPYITPYEWYNIKEGTYDWGRWEVRAMTALRVGTGATNTVVEAAVYLSFEDVELAVPMVPQMKKFGNRTEKEAKSYAEGTISGTLGLISSATGTLSKIPVLQPLMGPTSWFTSALAGAASSFGWSKPVSESAPMIMSKQYNRYMANSDGLDTAMPLGLQATNKLEVIDDISAYNADEMSFEFLKRVSTVIGTYTWTTSNDIGTSLLSKRMAPIECNQTGTYTAATKTIGYAVGPPIFYLSNHFMYYRGGLDIIIKFMKTDFHSGRLQITFTPYNSFTETAPTTATGQYALREIVDIRCGDEIKLKLPFLMPKEWNANNTEYLGHLDIVVLNELRAPDTVTQTVDFQLYVSGADDFQLAGPRTPVYASFSPQMDDSSCKAVDKPIGDSNAQSVTHREELRTIGESFNSIKQMLNRYNRISVDTSMAATTDCIAIWPHFYGSNYMSSTNNAYITSLTHDISDFMFPMYSFFRGGVKLGIYTDGTTTNPTGYAYNVQTTFLTTSPPIVPANDLSMLTGTSSIKYTGTTAYETSAGWILGDKNEVYTNVSCPYYAKTRCSLVDQTVNWGTPVVGYLNDPSQPMGLLFVTSKGNLTNFAVFRSFGDDFQLAFFLGCPPVAFSYA